MTSLGPFPLPAVLVIGAVVLAWLLARWLARGHKAAGGAQAAGSLVLDALFWGLLAARLAYIALWWRDYLAAPWSMIAVGDGGFIWWLGLAVALAYVWRRTRASAARALRPAVMAALLAGVAAWLAAGAWLAAEQRAALAMPAVALQKPDGAAVTLEAYRGQPVVLNLWASWCPPCRREMPVLAQGQALFPEVAFVMANQGENSKQVQAFLDQQALSFRELLLDPGSRLMQAQGAKGLPTTFFFDAQGRLVDAHMGELTLASLKHKVTRYFAVSD
ncbi:redoxin family protein [Kerstersia sp.]|uniref:redoxin family protein n=1 Tax=Kerstersia sp. TaxID=1930783 RepID=UPI003F902309